MPDVRLIPLGVGDAFTSRHYTTCFALGVDDHWLLLDCPHPVRKMWREASLAAIGKELDLDRVIGVAISHLHADHASGLEDFAYFNYFALKRRSTWLAHPAVSANLWDRLLYAGMAEVSQGPDVPPRIMNLDRYVNLIPLDPARPIQIGPFSIECRPTIHSIPTTAFRITVAGRVLGFSADSAYDPGLIAWLAPADLIIHEATTLDQSPLHTPYRLLAELPEELRRKMRLTHLPDEFDAASSLIEPVKQGRCYLV